MKRVNLAEARDRLSRLVEEAAYRKARIVLQSRGRPKAALVGLEDLERLESSDEPHGENRGTAMLRWLEETEKMLRRHPRLDTSAADILGELRDARDADLTGVHRREPRRKAGRRRGR